MRVYKSLFKKLCALEKVTTENRCQKETTKSAKRGYLKDFKST